MPPTEATTIRRSDIEGRTPKGPLKIPRPSHPKPEGIIRHVDRRLARPERHPKVARTDHPPRGREHFRMPPPPRRETAQMQAQYVEASGLPISDLESAKRFLTQVDSLVHRKEQDKNGLNLNQRAQKVLDIRGAMNEADWREFSSNPYIVRNLDRFFDLSSSGVKPEKIALACRIARKTKGLTGESIKELLPSINLGAYIALEKIAEPGLANQSARSIVYMLQSKINNQGRFENSAENRIIGYLSQVNPNLSGEALENALIQVISSDIYRKLDYWTQQSSWMKQSQGIEIEVLKQKTKRSNPEVKRQAPEKWLNRGVPLEAHKRKDWILLPLMGINEDEGERKYQVYEMSAQPSSTAVAQNNVIYELIAGGFVTEQVLSGGKSRERQGLESFSLHISTTFPKDIINQASLAEYATMARALSIAFATDQRIAFAGFMSGGAEIADKSAVGNLREIGKRKPAHDEISQDLALIEVRNLDVSAVEQFGAINNKQVLDYAFRSAWLHNANTSVQLDTVGEYAALRWNKFMKDTQQLFQRYGIDSKSLYKKYGPDWQAKAWQDIGEARVNHPQIKIDMAKLIRGCAMDIRGIHRQAIQANPNYDRQAEDALRSKKPRYLLAEPMSADATRQIFLPSWERQKLGVKPGDSIDLVIGKQRIRVAVARAKYRGDHTAEDTESGSMRVTADVLKALKLPDGYSIIPYYDQTRKEYRFASVERIDSPVVKMREPRHLMVEPQGIMNDRFYMPEDDRLKLGLKLGDEIYVRFGRKVQTVKIVGPKTRKDGSSETAESGNWRVSKNILKGFGLPEGLPLRGRFDKTTGEFVFGPSIAQFNKITDLGGGKIEVQGKDSFYLQSLKQAEGYGAFVCLVDPNNQNPDNIKSGLVDAYIPISGGWKKVRIPIPDVAYDKDVNRATDTKEALEEVMPFHLIPEHQKALTKDKYLFAETLREKGLSGYHPDTILLAGAKTLQDMLNKYGKLVLKPRFGQQGRGIMYVDKDVNGFYVRYPKDDSETSKELVTRRFSTAEELLAATQERRGQRSYIAQEKIDLMQYSKTVKRKDGTSVTLKRNPEIRVTLQRGIDGKVRPTGVVTRLHDPRVLIGEEYLEDPLITFAKLFPGQEEQKLQEFRELSLRGIKAIESPMKNYAAEITFDIGIKADGTPVIIEANSKAETRKMYSEAKNPDAVYQSTARPIEYALRMTDMN